MEDDWREIGNCSTVASGQFSRLLNTQMVMTVNGLSIINVIFVGILVVVGLYMPHYRHRSFIRFFFVGATTLFLPILSYVVSNGSTITSTYSKPLIFLLPLEEADSFEIMSISCFASIHLFLILLWVCLAQIIGINTSTMVAADDREGRNNSIPMVLLAQAMWTSYLVFGFPFSLVLKLLLWIFIVLLFAKLGLKCFAFWMARRSLAHARNPRLIVGYMMELHERSQHAGPTVEQDLETADKQLLPPPLIIMGEERQKVEKQPQGYCIQPMPSQDGITIGNNFLVTIDKVWQLDDKLLRPMSRIKEVCFSFALFKLLRSRFAGYTDVKAGFTQAHNFFWYEFIQDGTAERVFRVIEDELSFLHDYYYTSHPMFYSKSYLPKLSIITSLFIIQCCLFTLWVMAEMIKSDDIIYGGQIVCIISCADSSKFDRTADQIKAVVNIGSLAFDITLVSILLGLVVLAEVRDIGSYIFSNWTNVALICRHLAKHDGMERFPFIHECVSIVSGLKWKLMKHRMDKMNQCSLLVLHQRYHPTVLLTRIRILLHMGDQSKDVKVPPMVKIAIFNTLKASNGTPSSGGAFLPRSVEEGGNFIWNCSDKGVAHMMLICHIATSLLELRRPQPSPASDDEITATHLSRYCAYLVSHAPELLPDDDRWCQSLYKAVKKNSSHLLSCGATRYEVLVKLLSIPEAHEVLQKGAYLATQLVKEDGSTSWGVLAEFWSEMILHAASTSKLENHAEAMAGGAELITLLWALVMHAGPAPAPKPSTVVAPSAEVEVLVAH